MSEETRAPAAPNPPAQRFRRSSALERVRAAADFPVALRGYDREAVDAFVADVAQLVAELESTQLRENVVQRALDEVGEQTSGILQRAHETAEEITARSRAQAEGRIQRAEREADLIRRDAESYAERLVTETRRLWEERKRLIDDVRALADEVLATADDALDRLPEPQAVATGEAVAPRPGEAEAEAAPADEAGPGSGPGDEPGPGRAGEPTDRAGDEPTAEFDASAIRPEADSGPEERA